MDEPENKYAHRFTEEEKEEITKLYLKGYKYKEIADRIGGRTAKAISNFIERQGIANRKVKSNTASAKVCRKCKHVNPVKANYCMNCGEDIRDKNKILAEKMSVLFSASNSYPEGIRNNCVEILREIYDYLTKQGG